MSSVKLGVPLILPIETEGTEFHSIGTPLGTLNVVTPKFYIIYPDIKLSKYVFKAWLIRYTLALIANVFSEYNVESGNIFK